MKTNYYQKLATVAVFAVPVAPAVFLGLRLFAQGQQEAAEMFPGSSLSAVLFLLAVAAGLTAVGLELVGILSGHITARLFQRRDWRWLLTGAALIAYTILGFYSLRGTVGAFAFLIAPLIYFVTAVGNVADEQQAEDAATSEEEAAEARRLRDEQIAFERQQQQQQAAFERELAMSREAGAQQLQLVEAELRAKERAARAAARAAQPATTAQSRARAGNIPAYEPQQSQPTAAIATLVCVGCGYTATGQQQLKGHQRWCKAYNNWKAAQPVDEEKETAVPLHSSNGHH
jgi:hypothetical protein